MHCRFACASSSSETTVHAATRFPSQHALSFRSRRRHMRSSIRLFAIAALLVGVLAVAATTAASTSSHSRSAAKKTYTVGIDIPFHPIFDYVAAKSSTYFANEPFTVKFRFLDATTQVPAFGAGQLDVFTTPPSFIPRVMDQYDLHVAACFPLGR